MENKQNIILDSEIFKFLTEYPWPGNVRELKNVSHRLVLFSEDNKITLNTSSMVRGEELLELLESIVGFLVSHVHPYPLLPPSSVAYDGTSTDDLLKKMLEAYNKVLNKNIRLN